MSHETMAIIQREGKRFVAFCPEFDVASQGASVEQARANLAEAVELFLETASGEETLRRVNVQARITRRAVAVG